MSQQNLSSFIWAVADLLRGDYNQSEYGPVILPITVLQRLDCVLDPTKDALPLPVYVKFTALAGSKDIRSTTSVVSDQPHIDLIAESPPVGLHSHRLQMPCTYHNRPLHVNPRWTGKMPV